MFKKILKKIFGESKSGYDPLLRGYQPSGKNKLDSKNPPKGGSGLIPKGGIGENIPLKEVNINIGKQGQTIITGRQ